jgi:hypothetical protein
MFEAMAVSLGEIEILKQEDAGHIYADEKLRLPDFRLVLSDGSQMLVEVKNFYQGRDPTIPFELASDYLEGLELYADAMKCPLFYRRLLVEMEYLDAHAAGNISKPGERKDRSDGGSHESKSHGKPRGLQRWHQISS